MRLFKAPSNRFVAGLLHLMISALTIGTIAVVALAVWFPQAYVHMLRLDRLVVLMASVDLVAGPLLTTIVYKRGKPGLRFDLTVIGLLQAGLLIYGLSVMASTRPIYLVGVVDRFELVTANDIAEEDAALAAIPPGWAGPRLVGAVMPTDVDLKNKIIEDGWAGRDLHVQPRFFVPYEQAAPALLKKAVPLAELLRRANADEQQALTAATDGVPVDAVDYLAVHAVNGVATMLIERRTGRLIGPVGVDPWAIELRGQ